MWILEDEIEINVEKDVFEIILVWINCDKRGRKKCFVEFFFCVCFVYILCDFFCSNIVIDDLVKDNDCLGFVEEVL